MTKIDMGTSNTKDSVAPTPIVDDEKANDGCEKTDATEQHSCDTYWKMREILGKIGMDSPANDDIEQQQQPVAPLPPVGIDWSYIECIAKAQLMLVIMSSACLCISMLVCGFNFYRFTSTAWVTYLICGAYIGLHAGKSHSYAHMVAYTGMCTFQTLVYMSSMCWLLYVITAFDMHHSAIHYQHLSISGAMMILALGEVVTMMGTVVTGVLGLVGCCRGFGRMLQAQEQLLEERRELMRGVSVTI